MKSIYQLVSLFFAFALSASASAADAATPAELSSKSPQELLVLARNGNGIAARFLGYIYERGDKGSSKDLNQSEHWFKESAKLGDVHGTNRLIRIYMFGLDLSDTQKPRWQDICELAAITEQSSIQGSLLGASQLAISNCYFEGVVVKQSISKGLSLLIAAAQTGKSPPAARKLAEAYANANYGLKKDIEKETQWRGVAFENEVLSNKFSSCLAESKMMDTKIPAKDQEECWSLWRLYAQ